MVSFTFRWQVGLLKATCTTFKAVSRTRIFEIVSFHPLLGGKLNLFAAEKSAKKKIVIEKYSDGSLCYRVTVTPGHWPGHFIIVIIQDPINIRIIILGIIKYNDCYLVMLCDYQFFIIRKHIDWFLFSFRHYFYGFQLIVDYPLDRAVNLKERFLVSVWEALLWSIDPAKLTMHDK